MFCRMICSPFIWQHQGIRQELLTYLLRSIMLIHRQRYYIPIGKLQQALHTKLQYPLIQDQDGMAPIHHAAIRGLTDMISNLITKHKVDPKSRGKVSTLQDMQGEAEQTSSFSFCLGYTIISAHAYITTNLNTCRLVCRPSTMLQLVGMWSWWSC